MTEINLAKIIVHIAGFVTGGAIVIYFDIHNTHDTIITTFGLILGYLSAKILS